ncbi:MAG: riboflavin synthase [Flavobacteriales bacterium]|jgi:riboflavin synthase|nr:riboflavin synthase [Flavobacteriales bacterium]MDP4827972.1 riboflavin synthase [Flavobacteriales bacterium]
MFTGIIETLGTVKAIVADGTNLHITLSSPITSELKVDQSVAHNGTCLTVVAIEGDEYVVTAIEETLVRTSLNDWKEGDVINLERCMVLGGRLDGHIVQGHVDTVGVVTRIEDKDGSWEVGIGYDGKMAAADGLVTVPKGSICLNGTSLTVVESTLDSFSVAIIPYTWENTCFHTLKVGDRVNLEFDILGKYLARLTQVAALNQISSVS